ncbi:MAG: sigma-70 family RNA polymerase sigma factor [Solirubrobacterales bacterium]
MAVPVPENALSDESSSDAASGAAERALALAAAGGDGQAFADLYDRYEQRIFNYCLRILNDRHEAEDATQEAFLKVLRRLPEMEGRDFEFGPYLFTTARNSSYDMIKKSNRTEVMDEVPDTGSGHIHRDVAAVEEDPARSAELESQRELVREANGRLPVRQREVLVLREVEGLSYDEIAATMEMKPNAVAQLISRARTKLRGEMRLGAASGITAGSVECEKALPLMAARADGELNQPEQRIWLETHMLGCETCRLSEEAMAEAGISYRAWAPVVPAAYMFRDTLAKAATLTGSDWSGIERPVHGPAATASRWSASTLAGIGAGALMLAALVMAVLASQTGDGTAGFFPREPAAEQVSAKEPVKQEKKNQNRKKERKAAAPVEVAAPETEVVDVAPAAPSSYGSADPGPSSGGGGGKPDPTPPVAKPEPAPPVVKPEPTPPTPEPEPDPPVTPPTQPPVEPPTEPTPGTPGKPGTTTPPK